MVRAPVCSVASLTPNPMQRSIPQPGRILENAMATDLDLAVREYEGQCKACVYATGTIHTQTGWFCEALRMMTRPDSCCGRYVNHKTAGFVLYRSMPI